MNAVERQLALLHPSEFDSFPLGLTRLDRTGAITYYNEAEAKLAHRTINASLGLNYFRDVAPCTAVREFQGRFMEFVAAPAQGCSEPFRFEFLFGWGRKEVSITFVRRSADPDGIYVVVEPSDAD